MNRPTLYGLSQLPKRHPRIREYVSELGPLLVTIIEQGRKAFMEDDRAALAIAARRYEEIRGKGGRPDKIEHYFPVEKTLKGNMRTRAVAAEILQVAGAKLQEESILRYMRRSSDSRRTETPGVSSGKLSPTPAKIRRHSEKTPENRSDDRLAGSRRLFPRSLPTWRHTGSK